mmetsp:Transcript_128/g.291  ORF Transcript_128/g.291 Transcript_128/m.291 type:complete len:88 (+) Transcript_128:618-881(+)
MASDMKTLTVVATSDSTVAAASDLVAEPVCGSIGGGGLGEYQSVNTICWVEIRCRLDEIRQWLLWWDIVSSVVHNKKRNSMRCTLFC